MARQKGREIFEAVVAATTPGRGVFTSHSSPAQIEDIASDLENSCGGLFIGALSPYSLYELIAMARKR